MSSQAVMTTKAKLHPQYMQDILSGREAIDVVLDWISEKFSASASIKSWTPYWKEIHLHSPEDPDKYVLLRFRFGGPVTIKEVNNWDISGAELTKFSQTLAAFLRELGQALTQRRVADAIQAHYEEASRQVQEDDDAILMQFKSPPPTALLQLGGPSMVDMAVLVRPDQTLTVFARSHNESLGQGVIRRLLANLQISGIPLAGTPEIKRLT